MVSTRDFESLNQGSNPCKTFLFLTAKKQKKQTFLKKEQV